MNDAFLQAQDWGQLALEVSSTMQSQMSSPQGGKCFTAKLTTFWIDGCDLHFVLEVQRNDLTAKLRKSLLTRLVDEDALQIASLLQKDPLSV